MYLTILLQKSESVEKTHNVLTTFSNTSSVCSLVFRGVNDFSRSMDDKNYFFIPARKYELLMNV